jgi:predicted metal-dependent HD superfamily phosphohydrolase
MERTDAWLESWRQLGVNDSPTLRSLLVDVRGRYSEPHRYYHTGQHLDECFEKVRPLISLAARPAEVEIGLWFHDAIYDTQRQDNEERSAAWAQSAALGPGVDAQCAQRIYDLVMATRHAAEPSDIDAQVLVDADLSILGADPVRFHQYEEQVRREYAWVPEPIFRSTRAKILREFLGRRQIFCTLPGQARYESQARHNLQQSLAQLESSSGARV